MTYGAFNPPAPGFESPLSAATKPIKSAKECGKCGKAACACKGKGRKC